MSIQVCLFFALTVFFENVVAAPSVPVNEICAKKPLAQSLVQTEKKMSVTAATNAESSQSLVHAEAKTSVTAATHADTDLASQARQGFSVHIEDRATISDGRQQVATSVLESAHVDSTQTAKNLKEQGSTATWIVFGLWLLSILAGCFLIGFNRKVLDVIVGSTCIALAALVLCLIAPNTGMSDWFSWHPVLMTISIPCLMTSGRWAYHFDGSGGIEEKPSRRIAHASIMGVAAALALVGYLSIFKAHSPNQQFFGYNFAANKWEPDLRRIAHCLVGYVVLFAIVLQACMGLKKKAELDNDVKVFTFHGFLGKIIMFGGSIEMALAIAFWGFPTSTKCILLTFLAVTTFCATLLA